MFINIDLVNFDFGGTDKNNETRHISCIISPNIPNGPEV